MKHFLCSALLLAGLAAHGQGSLTASVPTNLQVTNITATTATITFNGSANESMGNSTCDTRISYVYAGGRAYPTPCRCCSRACSQANRSQ